jgi:hypothetical protein
MGDMVAKMTLHCLLSNYMFMAQIYEDSLEKVGEEYSLAGHPYKDKISCFLTKYMFMAQIYEDLLEKVGEVYGMVGHPYKDDIT